MYAAAEHARPRPHPNPNPDPNPNTKTNTHTNPNPSLTLTLTLTLALTLTLTPTLTRSETASDPRLFRCFGGAVLGGILPAALFPGGHHYFVSQVRLGLRV